MNSEPWVLNRKRDSGVSRCGFVSSRRAGDSFWFLRGVSKCDSSVSKGDSGVIPAFLSVILA